MKVANDNFENENDSEVQFQNRDASFQTAIDENDDKKDTCEKNNLLAFSPKNVPAASKKKLTLSPEFLRMYWVLKISQL